MSLITKVMFYKLLLVKKMAGNQSLNTFPNVGHLFSGILYFFTKLYTHVSLNEKFLLGNTTRNRLPGMI